MAIVPVIFLELSSNGWIEKEGGVNTDHILAYMDNFREKTKPTTILNFKESHFEPVNILGTAKELTEKIRKITNPFELMCEPVKKERPKESKEQLLQKIDSCPVRQLDIWRHYKGDHYIVVDLCISESTGEVLIIYHKTLNEDELRSGDIAVYFARPLSEWIGTVELENGHSVARYAFVTSPHKRKAPNQ